VIIAGIVIFIIIMIVMVIYCCRKSRSSAEKGTLRVAPSAVPMSADTEKDTSSKNTVGMGDFYSQNQATDVNAESGDNKPVSAGATPDKVLEGN